MQESLHKFLCTVRLNDNSLIWPSPSIANVENLLTRTTMNH